MLQTPTLLSWSIIEGKGQDSSIYASAATPPPASESTDGPTIKNPNLNVEIIYKGLKYPTAMQFLGQNDILVTEKDDGTVVRIVNGTISNKPLIHLPVAVKDERGLLGIAVAGKYVFLYLTEAAKVADDENGTQPLGNRLYRFELSPQHDKLENGTLLLNLPAGPGTHHNGGALLLGPDGNLYLAIGDLEKERTTTQNIRDGPNSDGSSVIYRITQNGKSAGSIFSGEGALIDKFYAYGIRNSFGLDFDPVTGKLWDTENGPDYGDEINLVEPGFNSGWRIVQGMSSSYVATLNGSNNVASKFDPDTMLVKHPYQSANQASLIGRIQGLLYSSQGTEGKYRDPEFVWSHPVGPTAIKFLGSDKLGKQYQNDMFVGDVNNGNLYHFKLNEQRTGLVLNGGLSDKIADNNNELQNVILGSGFGAIVDIETGPDGYLYILSFHRSEGTIFRIVPATLAQATVPEFSSLQNITTSVAAILPLSIAIISARYLTLQSHKKTSI
jgi:aldose sugar dehydrogenase